MFVCVCVCVHAPLHICAYVCLCVDVCVCVHTLSFHLALIPAKKMKKRQSYTRVQKDLKRDISLAYNNYILFFKPEYIDCYFIFIAKNYL